MMPSQPQQAHWPRPSMPQQQPPLRGMPIASPQPHGMAGMVPMQGPRPHFPTPQQQQQQPPPPRMNMMMGRPPHANATPHQHHPSMTPEMAPPMHLSRAPPNSAPAAAAIDEPEEGELRDS